MNDRITNLFLQYLKSCNVSEKTLRYYKSDIGLFTAWLIFKIKSIGSDCENLQEALPLLTKNTAEEYKDFLLKNGASAQTINRRLSAVRTLSKFLSEKEFISFDFAKEVKNISKAVNITPLKRVVNEFSSYLESQKTSPITQKNYLADINQLLRFIENQGKKEIQEITSKDIKRYLIIELSSSPETTKERKLSSFRKFFSWAKEENKIKTNPIEEYLKDIAYLKPIEKSISEITEPSLERKVFGNYPSHESLKQKINAYLAEKPRLQKLAYYLLYTRPKWYKTYHSLAISRYINLAILVVFAAGLGFGIYQQLFAKPQTPIAYPSQPTPPKRYLSFQGRLTNQYNTPITTATNITFKLYDASTGGNVLWNSAEVVCSVDPDEDGIFSILLGTASGDGYTCTGISGIDSSVFTENSEVWLGIKVGSDPEATPRIQIATVAYALNSETLQGYPIDATGSATKSTVVTMNSGGEVVLAEFGPKIKSVSGNFSVQGEAITLQANGGGVAGDITLSPASDGTVSILASGTTNDSLYIQNAQITSGALIHGYYGGTATDVDLLKLGSGATETVKFLVESSGDTFIASGADLFIGGIGLSDNATTSSGASLIGLYDDSMTYISGNTNVQSAIKQLDTAIGSITNESGWTDDGTIVRLTTSTDRVGIGTTSPHANTKVGILGNLAIGSQTYSDAAAPTNGLIVEGNVGIRTTAPNEKLQIGNAFALHDGGHEVLGFGYAIGAGVDLNTAGFAAEIRLDPTAGILGLGVSSSATTAPTANQLVVNSVGNVGIGTTSPASKLDVAGTAQLRGAAGGTGLYVNSAGNVGIGTTSPSYKLDVSGTGRFTGNLTLDSVSSVADNNKVLTTDSGVVKYIDTSNWDKDSSNDVSTFLGLTDTPSSYTGYGGYFVRVNTGATGLEFATNSSISPWTEGSGVIYPYTLTNNVSIGTSSNVAKLGVVGDTDEIQLLVRGNSTQTSNIFEIENSSSSNLLTVDNNGNLTLSGNITASTTDTINGLSISSGSLTDAVNITMSGTLDLGVNTIYDGNLTGNWNFNNGNLSGINNLTVSGTLTANGTIDTALSTGVVQANSSGVLSSVLGTTNYIPKWTSTGLSTTSNIYDNGANVGIGTTAPGYKLDVTSNGATTARLGSATGDTVVVGNGQGIVKFMSANGGFGGLNGYFDCTYHGCVRGYIGHGLDVLSPGSATSAYQVVSNYNASLIYFGNSEWIGFAPISAANGTQFGQTDLENTYTKFKITSNGISTVGGATAALTAGNVTFPGSGIWNTLGNVGIGTTAPGYKLDVRGDANIRDNNHYFGYTQSYTPDANQWAKIAELTLPNYWRTINGVITIAGSRTYTPSVPGKTEIFVAVGTNSNSAQTPSISWIKWGNHNIQNVRLVQTTNSLPYKYEIWINNALSQEGEFSIYGQFDGRSEENITWFKNLIWQSTAPSGIAYWDSTPIARIDTNVGIGTTSPSYKLDVSGTGRFTGAVVIDGNLELNSTLTDINNDTGTSGQVLSSTGTGVDWIDAGSLPVRWSSLTDPNTNLTLNHSNYTTTFNTSATTETFFTINANSLTSGKGVYISSTSTGLTGNLAEIILSGSNAANTGNILRVAQTGASSAAVPLMVTNLGTGASFRVNDETGDNDSTPFIIDASGKVGIGTETPQVSLDTTGSIRLRSTEGTIQIGNATNQNYNRIGTSATNRGLSTANDLLINGKLEVDQALFPDSGIYGSIGTLVVNFPNNDAWFSDEIWVDGKVGIGTTAPANKLSVIGGVNIGSSTYNVAAPTNGLIVEGNVGIGTTGPAYKLDVAGEGRFTAGLRVTGGQLILAPTNTYANMRVIGNWGGSPDGHLYLGYNQAAGSNIYFYGQGTNSQMILQGTTGNVGIGTMSFATGERLAVSNGTTKIGIFPGYIDNVANADWVTLDIPGTKGLRVWDNFSVSGNVGIGTTNLGIINTNSLGQFGLDTNDRVLVISNSTGSTLNLENTLSLDAANIGQRLGAVVFSNTSGQSDGHRQLTGIASYITGTGGNPIYTYLADLRFYTKSYGYPEERMRITEAGNVGIGTTAPGYKLHVTGDIYANGGWLRTSGNAGWYSESYGGGWYMFDTSWIRTYNSKSVWTNSGLLGSNGGLTVGYSGTTPPSGGAIIAGNVGIGTTGPTAKLHILQTTAPGNPTGGGVYVYNSATNGNAILAARVSSAAGDPFLSFDIEGVYGWAIGLDDADNKFKITRSWNFNTAQTALTINTNGNVGIGTTNPVQKLHVEGQCVAEDTLLPTLNYPPTKAQEAVGSWQLADKTMIKDVKPGMYVYSLDEKTGRIVPAKIKALLDMGEKPVFKITTEDGRSIETTGNHPYLVQLPYGQKAEEFIQLRESDSLAKFHGVDRESLSADKEFSQTRTVWIDGSVKESSAFNSLEYRRGQRSVSEVGVYPVSLSSQRQPLRNDYLSQIGSQTVLSSGGKVQNNSSSNPNHSSSDQRFNQNSQETKGAWIKVIYLREGDFIAVPQLLTANRQQQVLWAKIIKIEYTGKRHVYDIEVEGTHNFIANGILAHNTYLSADVGIGTSNPSWGRVRIEHDGVPLVFKETYQTGAGSLWRMPLDATILRFDASQDGTSFDSYITALAMTSNGYVGIGTMSPSYRLELPNTPNAGGRGRANSWVTYSDIKLKENIAPIENALDKVLSLRGVTFDWKGQGVHSSGFIAQEVEKIIPELVTTSNDGLKSLDYGRFTPYLVEAIKQQQNQISSLSAQLTDLSLTSTGDLNIVQDQNGSYQVKRTADNSFIKRIGAFAELVAGKIRIGLIEAKEITTLGFYSFQAQIDNLLITTGLVSPSIKTAMISPLADEKDLIIKIGDTARTDLDPGKLSIQNQEEEVASIDASGNATFSGSLKSEDLIVENNASIQGELTAENINTGEIRADKLVVNEIVTPSGYQPGVTLEEIERLLREAQADQDLLSQAEDWYNATSSAQIKNLIAENATLKNLFVTQSFAATSLSLSKSLSLGVDMVIQSQLKEDGILVNSIDTLSAPLSIQALAMAPVEIMAGKLRIETNGDVFITGDLYVSGRVKSEGITLKAESDLTRTDLVRVEDEMGNTTAGISASGSAQFKEVLSDKIVIAGAQVASDSSSLNNNEIQTNATAGSGIVPAGKEEISIVSPHIKAKSLVYITPTSDTKNYVLYIKAKEEGRMIIGFNRSLDIDVTFNWWVVDTSQQE